MIEALLESRFLSLERLIAFFVSEFQWLLACCAPCSLELASGQQSGVLGALRRCPRSVPRHGGRLAPQP